MDIIVDAKMMLENINSNIIGALSLLLGLIVVLHVLLVYPYNRTKAQWKIIDYIWLALAALGLISATNEAKQFINESKEISIKSRIRGQYETILYTINDNNSAWICRGYNTLSGIENKTNEVRIDYEKTCKWQKKTNEYFKNSIDTSKYNKIDLDAITLLNVKEKNLVEFIDFVKSMALKYNDLVTELKSLKKTEKVPALNFLRYLAPLLLITGLALRITKVSGELRHEIKKS